MAKLESIEGIGPVYAKQLKRAGIATVEALLSQGATKRGRQQIVEKSGIGHALILEWVNRANLTRVQGIGEAYADLLEEAGVHTIKGLRNRGPEHLYEVLVLTNEGKNLVRRLPTRKMVHRWVRQAGDRELGHAVDVDGAGVPGGPGDPATAGEPGGPGGPRPRGRGRVHRAGEPLGGGGGRPKGGGKVTY